MENNQITKKYTNFQKLENVCPQSHVTLHIQIKLKRLFASLPSAQQYIPVRLQLASSVPPRGVGQGPGSESTPPHDPGSLQIMLCLPVAH